jgi:hypothetical protein
MLESIANAIAAKAVQPVLIAKHLGPDNREPRSLRRYPAGTPASV